MARGWTFNFVRAFAWRVNSSGIATGQLDPNSLGSPPVTSHALDVRGPISATMSAPTYTRFEARGGGNYDGSNTGGVETMGRLEMTLDQEDPAFYTLTRGGLQDTTTILGSTATIFSDNSLNPSPFDCGLMMVRRKQSLTSVTTLYQHIIYPFGTASFTKPNPTQEGGMNTQTLVMGYDPKVSSKFPWGQAFGANQNWTNYNEICFMIESIYPYAMTTFVADGSATTYTLAFKPQYSTVTTGNTNNVTAINGVPTAATTIVTSTGVVTIAAAGTTGDLHVAFYPTQNYLPV
jgi:hypothetical protein